MIFPKKIKLKQEPLTWLTWLYRGIHFLKSSGDEKPHLFLKIYGDGLCSTVLIIAWLQSKVFSSITESKSGPCKLQSQHQLQSCPRLFQGISFNELDCLFNAFYCQSINGHVKEQWHNIKLYKIKLARYCFSNMGGALKKTSAQLVAKYFKSSS